MRPLNCKHLHYFRVVAAEGSIARAAEVLHLTPQTISGQLRILEEEVGVKLLEKSGRGLTLTDAGRLAFAYADEMFRLGRELQDVLGGRPAGTAMVFNVGVAMVMPKLLAYRVLEPALTLPEPLRLVCLEAPLEDLLADLAVHKVDMVLSDSPLNPALNLRAYNHPLGESGISFFAERSQAPRYRDGFPAGLEGAPFLMPTPSCALRPALEQWLEGEGVKPRVVAEFEDRALMKAFGEAGAGVFTYPCAVEGDVFGRTQAVKERFYAISAERRIKHPSVAAITQAARTALFV
jgi:LysR family transcriptional activator of nhaA